MRVVITIEGAQADVLEQEPDELVQFSTDGEYSCVDGCGMLTYPESELTGMAGTLTTITFTPSNAVLKRTGTVTSRMVFAPGTRNTFLYQTPYGTSTVGLETQRYRSTLGERGGVLELLYVVDLTMPAPTATSLRSPSENNKDYRIEGN